MNETNLENQIESSYNKKKRFIVNTVYIVIIALIIYLFFKYAVSLAGPFLFALLIASILVKPAKAISKATKLPRKLVSFFLVLLFYSAAGVLVSLAGVKLVSMSSNLITSLPAIYEEQFGPFLLATFDAIEKAVTRIDPALVEVLNEGFDQFVKALGENVTNISLALVGALSNLASSLPAFLIKILLMVISTFFIAIDFEALSRYLLRQFSQRGNGVLSNVKDYMVNTLLVVIRSYGLIMSITFIELSIAFSILGLENAILIALIIAMFDILPVLGTGGVMVPWTIITAFQGDYRLAAGLLAVYVIVTIVRNVVEPKIVGSQLGLHPVVTLMSMFIGVNLLGVIGLFGLPITLSLLKHLSDSGTIKLFK